MILTIHRKWFDAILDEGKEEEYREIKPFYTVRFIKEGLIKSNGEPFPEGARPLKEIIFRNGYRSDSPKFKALVSVSIGTGHVKWGAAPGKQYYILKIHAKEELPKW